MANCSCSDIIHASEIRKLFFDHKTPNHKTFASVDGIVAIFGRQRVTNGSGPKKTNMPISLSGSLERSHDKFIIC